MFGEKISGPQLVALKDQVVNSFIESNWRELGGLTDTYDLVENQPRLLRSLSWGDVDYDGIALKTLKEIIDIAPQNLEIIRSYLTKICPESGVSISSQESEGPRIVFTPTVFKVPSEQPDSNLVSVMMPFEGSLEDVYKTIGSAAANSGLICKRADDIWVDSTIIQDVFSLIFQSYIVVCDFTGKNPNVFYEAGIAHTLGKHVIPITQNAEDIPFDLRHHRYIPYLNNSEGWQSLESKLQKRIQSLVNTRQSNLWR